MILYSIQINIQRGRLWSSFHIFDFLTCTAPRLLFPFNTLALHLLYRDLFSGVLLVKDVFLTKENCSDTTLWAK